MVQASISRDQPRFKVDRKRHKRKFNFPFHFGCDFMFGCSCTVEKENNLDALDKKKRENDEGS